MPASHDVPLPRSPGTTRRPLPDTDGLRSIDPVELPETPRDTDGAPDRGGVNCPAPRTPDLHA